MTPHEGRMAVVRRLASILLYTNRCRLRPTAQTIARGLGVSTRTVQRYLAAIEEAGWPMPPKRHEN